jgi:ketosteroid isomerase-like protein
MTDRPRAIAQRIDAAFHRRDNEALAAFWADDIDYATPDVRLVGKPARKAAEQALLDAFPNARITERGFVESGDSTAMNGAATNARSPPAPARRISSPFVRPS